MAVQQISAESAAQTRDREQQRGLAIVVENSHLPVPFAHRDLLAAAHLQREASRGKVPHQREGFTAVCDQQIRQTAIGRAVT